MTAHACLYCGKRAAGGLPHGACVAEYARRRAAGLCIKCGAHPMGRTVGGTWCTTCHTSPDPRWSGYRGDDARLNGAGALLPHGNRS